MVPLPIPMMARATPADVNAIVALQGRMGGREGWDQSSVEAVLRGGHGGGHVIRGDDQLLGFALWRMTGDEAELLLIAVAPEARRQGWGRQLVVAAAAEVVARGAKSLLLEVAAGNGAGRALYERLGFTQVGQRKGYYGRPQGADGPAAEDALILALTLTPPSR